MKKLVCKTHRKYLAKRQPVSTTKHPGGCAHCWAIWNATQEAMLVRVLSGRCAGVVSK